LPGVAYSGFRDNRSTLNTKTDKKDQHCYSTLGPVSAWVGDRLWTRVIHHGTEPGTTQPEPALCGRLE